MVRSDDSNPNPDDENLKKNNSGQSSSREPQKDVRDDFSNRKKESNTSIGTGSADQGIDVENLKRESEFGDIKDVEMDDASGEHQEESKGDPREKFGFNPLPPDDSRKVDQDNERNKKGKGHGLV